MSAAQSSRFFGRMKSAFLVDPKAQKSLTAHISSFSSTNPDDRLAFFEEALLQAEQQTTTSASETGPVVAETGAPTLNPDLLPTASTANPLDVVAQAVPSVIAQQTDTLNVGYVSSSPKEVWQVAQQPAEAVTTPELPSESLGGTNSQESVFQPTVEAATQGQYMEVEPPSPEIPVEVEGYLQEVKDHQDQLPQEIVVAADQVMIQPAQPQSLRPVVVLPITPEMETVGLKKNPSWSLRWLVTWSRKLMKIFAGKIIYHPEQPT